MKAKQTSQAKMPAIDTSFSGSVFGPFSGRSEQMLFENMFLLFILGF